MKIHWVIPVWGESHTRVFADITLPSLMAPKNLPALKTLADDLFEIYTTREDEIIIRHSPAFRGLSNIMATRFIHFNPYDAASTPGYPITLLTVCHDRALQIAASCGAACAPLVADCLFNDGGIAAIEAQALAGIDVVLTTGLRSPLPEMHAWISGLPTSAGGGISIEARAACARIRSLSGSFLEHQIIGSPHFSNDAPHTLLAPVGEDSFAVLSYVRHPVLVRQASHLPLRSPIDVEYFIPPMIEAGVAHASFGSTDICLHIEVSAPSKLVDMVGETGQFDPARVAQWVESCTVAPQRRLMKQPIRYIGGENEDRAWDAAFDALHAAVNSVERIRREPAFEPVPMGELEQLDRTRPIYFYGSGDFGQSLFRAMEAEGEWRFGGFLDSFDSGTCLGRPRLRIADYAQIAQPDDQIIITSSRVVPITHNLKDAGFSSVFDARPWRDFELLKAAAVHVRFEDQRVETPS